MRDKIILILGTFNPPTVAHVAMSVELHKDYPESKICYVPSNSDYVRDWKSSEELLPMSVRSKLLLDAVDNSYASVSMFEGSKSSDGKTITTARHFRDKGYDVTLCIGSDNLRSIKSWYKSQELVRDFDFIVFIRGNGDKNYIPKDGHFVIKPFDYSGVSSTRVREAFKSGDGKSVKSILPRNVYDFMMERYQNEV